MLPASFAKDGFFAADKIKSKYKHLLIGTDGWSNTGKSEFALSAPGPGIFLCLDRGHEAMLDNSNPPSTRQDNFAFKVIKVPLSTQMTQEGYVNYWKAFCEAYWAALDNPDARTVVIDGDSDSWELQRLANFGKLTRVLPIKYTEVNAQRRAMIARAFDSGKVVIFTNKVKEEYDNSEDDAVGKKTGNVQRQGYKDQDYLYQLQLRHLYDAQKGRFGVKILKCKTDTTLQGMEFWGDECNFESVMSAIYPNVSREEWGY